jgi:2OG-Fe(II) oxygenase superfamily
MAKGNSPSPAEPPIAHITVKSDFFDRADEMRQVISERFQSGAGIDPRRFAWDYWHVPDMFTCLRALPQAIFPEELFLAFVARLTNWGQEQLGCRTVFAPMLNCHLHDCWHGWHADGERGPWAYVLSLTDWKGREFSGGETLIFDPLRYASWRASTDGREPLFTAIAPHFNQLTVFDARLPHSVRQVEGVREPAKGRLALVGWFRNAGIVTDLPAEHDYRIELDKIAARLREGLRADRLSGRLVLHLRVSGDAAPAIEVTVNTLDGDPERTLAAIRETHALLEAAPLAAAPDSWWATIPIHLDNSGDP